MGDMKPEYFDNMTAEVALRVFTRRPGYDYAMQRVLPLLRMTVAHESGDFQYRRQQGEDGPLKDYAGGYGLVQMEPDTVAWMLDYIHRRDALFERIQRLLRDWDDELGYQHISLDWGNRVKDICHHLATPDGDVLGLALARMRYLPDRHFIPAGVEAQAQYAKRVYNTSAGAATPADYVRAYWRHWA